MNQRRSHAIATFAALVSGTAALLAVLPDPWNSKNADHIREAVIRAALTHPHGPRQDSTLVVCLSTSSGEAWASHNDEDPSPELPRAIQSIHPLAPPGSECENYLGGVRHRPSGADAVRIGVARVHRVSATFVKVEGGWFYSALNAVGWRYTLSRVGSAWVVDTETFLWIS
jgi:hypothetical protein